MNNSKEDCCDRSTYPKVTLTFNSQTGAFLLVGEFLQ